MTTHHLEPEQHSVKTGGDCYLHYSSTGRATQPALVFIPGWGGERWLWQQHQQWCAQNYHSLVVDLPGFGQSPLPPGCDSIEAMAALIIQVLDQQNIERATLLGHSLGGALALCCAALYPERISQVIGVDSLVYLDIYAKVEAAQAATAVEPFASDFEQSVRAISAAYFLPGSESENQSRAIEAMCQSDPVDGVTVLKTCFEWDMADSLDKYPGPVNVIVAEAAYPAQEFESAYGQRVGVQIVKNSGHFIMLDQPEELQARIETALNKVVSPTR